MVLKSILGNIMKRCWRSGISSSFSSSYATCTVLASLLKSEFPFFPVGGGRYQWGMPCHVGCPSFSVLLQNLFEPRRHASFTKYSNRWVPFSEIKNIGLLWWKHPYFWSKTSVLCTKEVRCFAPSGPSPRSPLYKKSFWKSPTFPTPRHRMSCIYWRFRVKDRV